VDAAPTDVRRTTSGMRRVFRVGSVLVTAAGIQLFLLTDHTDELFAWTIKNPLTSAFLGTFYFTALTLAALSAREAVWARARVGVAGVFVFVTLTMVATLLHLDQFHFHSTEAAPRGAAYLWFAIYLVAPVAVAILWPLQLRAPGADPPREHPLPGWFRLIVALHSAVVLAVGVALFVAPDQTSGLWPWTLTPLTSRAVAAWLVGLGLVLAQAARENAWERVGVACASYAVLGVLELVAVARYPHAKGLDWSSPKAWVYLAYLVTVLAAGAFGWVTSRRAVSIAGTPRPAVARA